jgi:hypothetical protein
MSEHPPSFRLDAHAAGDEEAAVGTHLSECGPCRTYVDAMKLGAAAFAADNETSAAAFLSQLRGREPKAAESVPLVAAAQPTKATGKMGGNLRLVKVAWIAAPMLAAAAAVFFVVRPVPSPAPRLPMESTARTRFKGDLQLTIVRDRDGYQQKLSAEVPVRPRDRIRVEIGVSDERPIVVGMFGKDGTWVPLLLPAVLEAGTHISERAAQFDDSPTEGWILAGHPDAVESAKKTRIFDEIMAIPVVREP